MMVDIFHLKLNTINLMSNGVISNRTQDEIDTTIIYKSFGLAKLQYTCKYILIHKISPIKYPITVYITNNYLIDIWHHSYSLNNNILCNMNTLNNCIKLAHNMCVV